MATSTDLASLLSMLTNNVGENAYQTLAGQMARIGEQEAQTGINYERDLAELGYGQDTALDRMHNAFANRGTLRSGIAVGAEADQDRKYNYLLDQLARGKQTSLSDLAEQRLNSQAAYNSTMAQLQSDFAGKSTEFIAARLEEDAKRKANLQDMTFQQQLQELNQRVGTAQESFYKQQGDYYSGLTKSLGTVPSTVQAGTTSGSGQTVATPATNIPPGTVTTSRSLAPAPSTSYQSTARTEPVGARMPNRAV